MVKFIAEQHNEERTDDVMNYNKVCRSCTFTLDYFFLVAL